MNLLFRGTMTAALYLPLAGLAACKQAEEASVPETSLKEAPDPAQAEISIEKAQAARISALNNRDVDGAVSVYAPDATLVIPNVEPLTDPASIRANYASLLGDDSVKITVTPTRTWVSAGADFAVTTAQISFADKVPGERPSVSSTNQSVWQRQADGTWKIVSEYSVALPSPRNREEGDAAVRSSPVDANMVERAESVPSD